MIKIQLYKITWLLLLIIDPVWAELVWQKLEILIDNYYDNLKLKLLKNIEKAKSRTINAVLDP